MSTKSPLYPSAPWPEWPYCPCGCEQTGLKLQTRHDRHLVGCSCRSCIGRRNRKKGQASEARAHRQLGGPGPTIRDDLFHLYSIDISLENKGGAQLPAKFASFIESEWVRHAFRQAAKKTPVGTEAFEAIRLELAPSNAYLVVKLGGKALR